MMDDKKKQRGRETYLGDNTEEVMGWVWKKHFAVGIGFREVELFGASHGPPLTGNV